MSAKQQVALQNELDSAISEATAAIQSVATQTLEAYWQIGKLVSGLQTKYGEGVIKRFAEQLAAKINREISPQTVYRMHQFFVKHSRPELEKLKQAGVSWTQVIQTLPQSPEAVSAVIDAVAAGDLKPTEFAKAASTHESNTRPTPAENGPSDSASAVESDSSSDSETDQVVDRVRGKVDAEYKILREIDKTSDIYDRFIDSAATIIIAIDNAKRMNNKDVNKGLEELRDKLRIVAQSGGALMKELETFLGASK